MGRSVVGRSPTKPLRLTVVRWFFTSRRKIELKYGAPLSMSGIEASIFVKSPGMKISDSFKTDLYNLDDTDAKVCEILAVCYKM
ncbi:jg3983 [Pararge aegeria aegeria]|uniref:Jg3983 protein n=1 Tax=Pararge aegeria aegeria TaxID=348720 RepID=A0A8S4RWM7_9NEOP|nr:jg3983 [Pararge aegeria aegeria]